MIPSLRTACSVAEESAKLRNLPPRRIPEPEYREITENAVIIEVQKMLSAFTFPFAEGSGTGGILVQTAQVHGKIQTFQNSQAGMFPVLSVKLFFGDADVRGLPV